MRITDILIFEFFKIKKLFNERVFRKKILSFVIICFVGVVFLAGIFFMYSFWRISGEVINQVINQDLNLDSNDLDSDDNDNWNMIPFFGFENETYFEEGIFASSYYLKNDKDFNAGFRLETTCNTLKGDYGCGYVDWWYEYKLLAIDNEPKENKIIILAPDAGIEKFNDFEKMSWEVFMSSGSFPYVNIFLENEGGEMVLSIYGNYQINEPLKKQNNKWFNTFEGISCSTNCFIDLTDVNNETNALMKKSYESDVSLESLKKYKERYGDLKVLRFEIKIDNIMEDSESRVRKIIINGNQYEASGLEVGKQLDFDFKVIFPEKVYPGNYTITTQVLPR
jgi:hypothetical protein